MGKTSGHWECNSAQQVKGFWEIGEHYRAFEKEGEKWIETKCGVERNGRKEKQLRNGLRRVQLGKRTKGKESRGRS